jgi:hypothetical protein
VARRRAPPGGDGFLWRCWAQSNSRATLVLCSSSGGVVENAVDILGRLPWVFFIFFFFSFLLLFFPFLFSPFFCFAPLMGERKMYITSLSKLFESFMGWLQSQYICAIVLPSLPINVTIC